MTICDFTDDVIKTVRQGIIKMSGIFPFDDTARAFYREHGLEIPENVPYTDDDAVIKRKVSYDLDELEPFVAAPADPANIVPLRDVLGTKLDQGFIGSCAGGRLEDLEVAARILKGKKSNPAIGCMSFLPQITS